MHRVSGGELELKTMGQTSYPPVRIISVWVRVLKSNNNNKKKKIDTNGGVLVFSNSKTVVKKKKSENLYYTQIHFRKPPVFQKPEAITVPQKPL